MVLRVGGQAPGKHRNHPYGKYPTCRQATLGLRPAPLLSSCITLGNWHNLSEPQLWQQEMGLTIPPCEGCLCWGVED